MDDERKDGSRAADPERGTSAAEAARKYGLTIAEIEDLEGTVSGRSRERTSEQTDERGSTQGEQHKCLKQKIGDLVMDIDILKEAQKPYLPTTPGTSEE